MPGPRPKHNEAATDEAETLGGRLQSSIMRTGVVVALKIARIKKVRGSGLPCERLHSLISGVSAGRTSEGHSVSFRENRARPSILQGWWPTILSTTFCSLAYPLPLRSNIQRPRSRLERETIQKEPSQGAPSGSRYSIAMAVNFA